MSKGQTLEMMFEIWDNDTGYRVEIGKDRDGLGCSLCEQRTERAKEAEAKLAEYMHACTVAETETIRLTLVNDTLRQQASRILVALNAAKRVVNPVTNDNTYRLIADAITEGMGE
jgi:hypothetical protein